MPDSSNLDTLSCEELSELMDIGLTGVDLLCRLSDSDLALVCNGLGPSWFPSPARRALDRLNPTLRPAVMIHDLRYFFGDGTSADFHAANRELRENGLLLACHRYRWYDPRRYIVSFRAIEFSRLCEKFGWLAYSAAIRERSEWEKRGKMDAYI